MTTAAPPPTALSATQRPWQFSLLKLLIWFVVLSLVLAFCRAGWVAISFVRNEGTRLSCLGNHTQLSVALHEYHDQWGSFPLAYTVDAAGKPMHSWRVLILPYIKPELAARYNYSEPWDGPNNIQLASEMPRIFCCPACESQRARGETNYVAVVGPGTPWPGTGVVALAECTDKNTLLIVETHDSGICWLEPRDLEFSKLPLELNPGSKPSISSRHPGRVNYSTLDGQGRTLHEGETTPAQLKALITVTAGD